MMGRFTPSPPPSQGRAVVKEAMQAANLPPPITIGGKQLKFERKIGEARAPLPGGGGNRSEVLGDGAAGDLRPWQT